MLHFCAPLLVWTLDARFGEPPDVLNPAAPPPDAASLQRALRIAEQTARAAFVLSIGAVARRRVLDAREAAPR